MKAFIPNSKLSIVSIHMGQKIARDLIIGKYIEKKFYNKQLVAFHVCMSFYYVKTNIDMSLKIFILYQKSQGVALSSKQRGWMRLNLN